MSENKQERYLVIISLQLAAGRFVFLLADNGSLTWPLILIISPDPQDFVAKTEKESQYADPLRLKSKFQQQKSSPVAFLQPKFSLTYLTTCVLCLLKNIKSYN